MVQPCLARSHGFTEAVPPQGGHRLEREIERADNALEALEKIAGTGGHAEINRLMEDFDQALKGLQNGAMKPNPQLLEQMRKMDLKNSPTSRPSNSNHSGNPPETRQEPLKIAEGLGEGENGDEDSLADEDDEGKDGQGPGKGGVDRGPGHVPGVLGKRGRSPSKPAPCHPWKTRTFPRPPREICSNSRTANTTSTALPQRFPKAETPRPPAREATVSGKIPWIRTSNGFSSDISSRHAIRRRSVLIFCRVFRRRPA